MRQNRRSDRRAAGPQAKFDTRLPADEENSDTTEEISKELTACRDRSRRRWRRYRIRPLQRTVVPGRVLLPQRWRGADYEDVHTGRVPP